MLRVNPSGLRVNPSKLRVNPSKLRVNSSECAIDKKWKKAWKSLRPEGLGYTAAT
jgi:hypothetical protein